MQLWLDNRNSCLHVDPVLIFNLGGKCLCLYLGQRIHSAQYLALLVHSDLDLKVATTQSYNGLSGSRSDMFGRRGTVCTSYSEFSIRSPRNTSPKFSALLTMDSGRQYGIL